MKSKIIKFIKPEETKFIEYRSGVYLYEDININAYVSRYMNIAELLGMMRGEIFVPMRMSFPDKLELGIPYNRFSHCVADAGRKITYRDKRIWANIIRNRIAIKNWFTLCFSEELQERASFWNAFTKGVDGVFVKIKLDDFISAIDTTNFNLYIGKIKYRESISTHDLVDFAFTKETPYRDEKEIRIYLLPKSGELKWEYEDNRSRYKMNFNFNPQIFSKITLSPFIPGIVKPIFIRELFETNKFNREQLEPSKIH